MRSLVSSLVKLFSINWTWWNSTRIEFSITITISKTVLSSCCLEVEDALKREDRYEKYRFLRIRTISWIITITWIVVYREGRRFFIGMSLILVQFKASVERLSRHFSLRTIIPFSLFMFALFAKTKWKRVICFMTKVTIFAKWRFSLTLRISCLCKHDFRIWILSFSR